MRPVSAMPPRPPRTQAEELRLLARTAWEQGRREEAAELYRKADFLETANRDRA